MTFQMDLQTTAKATWTAYPELLAGEDDSNVRGWIEAVAEARQCGRYREAHHIFSERLPDPATRPLLAFEYADLLTDQGLEGDRLAFLTRAASTLQSNATVEQYLLVELMLADVQIWAEGHLYGAVTSTRGLRNRFVIGSIDNLSDIQVRFIQLYHQIMKTGFQHSKCVTKDETTFFAEFCGDLFRENNALSVALRAKEMHVAATRIMVEQLSAASNKSQAETLCQYIMSYCDQLDTSESLALLTRSIQTRFEVIDRARNLQLTELAQEARNAVVDRLGRLSDYSKKELEVFVPKLFAKFTLRRLREDVNLLEQVDGLATLADTLIAQESYTMANTVLSVAVNKAQPYATASRDPGLSKKLQLLFGRAVDLHRNITHMIYFEAEALLQLVVLADLNLKAYEDILDEVSSFQRSFPLFDIPTSLERLYTAARNAAQQTGQKSLANQYNKDLFTAYSNCPRAEIPVTLAQVDIEVKRNGDLVLNCGINALQLALSWANAAYACGELSEETWKEMFGFYTPDDLSPGTSLEFEDFLNYIRRDAKLLSVSYFEISGEPISQRGSRDQWKLRFNKLQAWLLADNLRIPRESRTFILQKVALGWGFRQRKSWIDGLSRVIPENTLQQFMAEDESLVTELTRIHESEVSISASLPSDIQEKQNNMFKVGVGRDKIEQVIRDSEDVYREYLKRNNQLGMYTALMRQAEYLWQKHSFGLVSPDESVAVLLRAEQVSDEVRQSRSIPSAEHNSISGKLEQLHKFNMANLYQLGIHRSETGWRQARELLSQVEALARAARTSSELSMADGLESFARDLATKSTQRFASLVAWTQKSKSRALLDLLGIDAPIPPDLVEKCQQSSEATEMLRHERKLVQQISDATFPEVLDLRLELNLLRNEMRQNHILKPVMAIRDGDTVNLEQIEGMLNDLPNSLVIIDFFKVPSNRYLQVICYRKGSISSPLSLLGMDWGAVEAWTKQNLKSKGPRKAALAELTPLLSLLFEQPQQSPEALPIIRKGDTIVFCPTGILHRIPLHAIPIEDGVPLIVNHPVVYCPSLSILRHCLQSAKGKSANGGEPATKRLVLNPMPPTWDNDPERPVLSTPVVKKLAKGLGAEYIHCWNNVGKTAVMDSLQGVGLLHYHGHVVFKKMATPNSSRIASLQSFLRLGQMGAAPENQVTGQDIFGCKLSKPALATIVGCQSHLGDVSPADDLLGVPMALYFAGAAATVSSLWKLDDVDGANWAKEFYGDMKKQCGKVGGAVGGKSSKELGKQLEGVNIGEGKVSSGVASADSTDNRSNDGMVDLALAMQKAVKELRFDHNGLERDPCYWAGYVLSNSWVFPSSRI